MMYTGNKIVEEKNGNYYALFHGTEGTKMFPIREWINASKKQVRDGAGDKYYESGFHFFPNLEDAKKYLKRFRSGRNLIIVPILAQGIRPKETNNDVYLADTIFFPA